MRLNCMFNLQCMEIGVVQCQCGQFCDKRCEHIVFVQEKNGFSSFTVTKPGLCYYELHEN